ncbi:MAG: phenylalanine--tRNA ligase subunit beta [Bacilli bacterium]|nr:phenylalanine--tRNA ligase subunit beta [Bacilli bacterium]
MRISLNWLKDYVDINKNDAKDIAEKITRAGVNVEGIKNLNISNLVVGLVEDKKPHPDSDHLNVCMVNIGNEVKQIVCGAPNVDKGQKIILAIIGAVLPGDFEIKQTIIRGIESNGMICALYELGLEDKETNYQKGIHVLDDNAIVGSNPAEYLGLDDVVYELDLNPNRNDCLSHLGFAYETASVLNKKVTTPEIKYNEIDESIINHLTLKVDTNNCTMYKTKIVKNVVIKESPLFIKNRLISAGMRPINNVVDISNYIMLEYGQPLHFFDKAKVGDNLIVRMATDKEEAITLDNKTRILSKEDIVITNNKEIIAIAGVMGCLNSEVDNNTNEILIESAIFNPYNVRYTSLNLGLRSEASLRFEKTLNYEYTEEALERACFLLEKYASGKVLKDSLIYDKIDKTKKIVDITKEKICNVLGMPLTDEDIIDAFNRLEFKFNISNNIYTVEIPNRRMDVSIKEDLIEEVGRLYGYDNIIGKLPLGPIKKGEYNEVTLFRKIISKRMRSLGLNEARTYTLVSNEEATLFNYYNKEPLSLMMPMSSDKSIIRQSIIPSLLKEVDYNLSRNVKNINLYEISNIYYKENNNYIEETKLAFALLGSYISNNIEKQDIKADFYLVKGIVENLFNYLGLANYNFQINNNIPKELHPGISAEIIIDGVAIGYIGKLHPSINKQPIYVGEINISKLFKFTSKKLIYKEVPKFPSISKDIAFVIDKNITSESIVNVIKEVGGLLLINVEAFDIYEGVNIDPSKKSIAFNLVFNDETKTLTDNEVNTTINSIIKEVDTKLNGLLRNK